MSTWAQEPKEGDVALLERILQLETLEVKLTPHILLLFCAAKDGRFSELDLSGTQP